MQDQSTNLDELVGFLTELAVQLLAKGVSLSEFQAATKLAYVQAASRAARLRNRRVNQSAIAAITGLSRVEVRRLLASVDVEAAASSGSRVEKVLSGWRTDPDFLDAEGFPACLTVKGPGASFTSLTKKYASDVSSPKLLQELLRLGLAQQFGEQVRLAVAPPTPERSEAIRNMAVGLAHAVRAPNDAEVSGISITTAEAEVSLPPGPAKLLLKRRIEQGCRALAVDIRAAGEALEQKHQPRPMKKKLTTKILIVTME